MTARRMLLIGSGLIAAILAVGVWGLLGIIEEDSGLRSRRNL